jgi:hypothetical protein
MHRDRNTTTRPLDVDVVCDLAHDAESPARDAVGLRRRPGVDVGDAITLAAAHDRDRSFVRVPAHGQAHRPVRPVLERVRHELAGRQHQIGHCLLGDAACELVAHEPPGRAHVRHV